MKKILTLSFSIIAIVAFAQVPQGLNYQAVARDILTMQAKKMTNINVKFTILKDSVNGTPVYTETHSDTTNEFGLFTLTIGHGISADTFLNIDWATGTKFLKVEIDNQLTGTTQLWSVPYSFAADRARSVSYWEQIGLNKIYTTKKVGINIIPENSSQFQIKGNTVGMPFAQGNILNLSSVNAEGGLVFGKLNADGTSFIQSSKANTFSNIVLNPEGGFIGIGTSNPQRDLDVDGVSRSRCVEVTGGCDIVENVNSTEILQPGEVIVTDPNNPSQVLRSNKVYDRLAIGVVSGAGGITHGVLLSQKGVLDGNVSFAIAGRVKVKVTGEVKPGDLLTTSNIAGHAMVAKNKRRRDGAIIGKALTVPDPNGLVLMLVTIR